MIRFLFLILLFPQLLFAATYYVDGSGGNDSNAGTSWGAAFATIQKAIDSCSGTTNTIYLSDNAVFTLSSAINWSTYSATTTSTAPLIIEGASNGGSLTVEWGDGTSNAGAHIDCNSAVSYPFAQTSHPFYVGFNNIKFLNCTTGIKSPAAVSYANIEVTGMDGTNAIDITSGHIANSYVHANDNTGIKIASQGSALFNRVVGDGTGTNRGIQATNGNIFVAHNVVDNYPNVPLEVSGNYSVAINNTIICAGGVVEYGLWHNAIHQVSLNNIIMDCDYTGSYAIFKQHSPAITGYNTLYNNTNDENATVAVVDLTSNNVTETSSPIVGSGNYALTSGTNSEDAAINVENGFLDVGAVESTAAGGAAATTACGFVQ